MANVIDIGPSNRSNWKMWRDVVTAWIVAVVLAGALLLTVPDPEKHGPFADFQPFAAATHTPHKAPDVEGPSKDEECSERDYVNERC
jgi:hypothetical protein